MRVALCLAGQPRGYKIAYDYVKKNLLDVDEVDVFFHTWVNPVYDVEDVLKLYNPKAHVIHHPWSDSYKSMLNEKYKNTPDASKWPPSATIASYYSIFQANLLRIKYEQATQSYDVVIKSRFDYALNGVIPANQVRPDMLYVPNCRMVPDKNFGNDQFAFGSSDVMTDYMSTYLHIDTFYRQGTTLIGEDLLWENCKKHGLVGENLTYVNMNNPFPPGPYNGSTHSLVRDDMDLWKGL